MFGTTQVCHEGCLTCDGPDSDNCLTCKKQFFVNANRVCEFCSIQNCAFCNEGLAIQIKDKTCKKCDAAFYLLSPSNSLCTLCTEGNQYKNLQEMTCNKCAENCSSCGSDSYCNVCEKGYFQVNGVCNKCVDQCDECLDSVIHILFYLIFTVFI